MNMAPVSAFLLILAFAGCELLRSESKEPPLEPGRRDYVWTVDTLYSPPGGFVSDIWGSSPDDMWAPIGGNGIYHLFHYNGTEWSVWPEARELPGQLECIYGFARNNVWMGSNDGRIYHFNGSKWSLAFTYKPEGTITSTITDIWGTAPNNFFAVGVIAMDDGSDTYQSYLLHYNGKNWRVLLVTDFDVQFHRVRVHQGKAHIMAVKLGNYPDPDVWLIYRYSSGKLHEILTTTSRESQTFSMTNIGNRIYANLNNEIRLLGRHGFKKVLEFPNLDAIVWIDGRHENDMFILTLNEIFHFNGEDAQLLLDNLPRNVYRAQLFSREVFFHVINVNEGTNLIYHGTLNEQEE